MGISPYACGRCAAKGRCARVDGTSPYARQDEHTPEANRCTAACRGRQFCFEMTTVFVPKRLVSAAKGAKHPLQLDTWIACVYDGYHHHPVGRAHKRKREGGEGEGEGEEEEGSGDEDEDDDDDEDDDEGGEEDDDEEEGAGVECDGTGAGAGAGVCFTSGAFLVPPSLVALVAESAFHCGYSPESVEQERMRRGKRYMVVGDVFCHSCWVSLHGETPPTTAVHPLQRVQKSREVLEREAEEARREHISWRLGTMQKYDLAVVAARIPQWMAEETPGEAQSRELNTRVRRMLEDKDKPQKRAGCAAVLATLCNEGEEGGAFGFILDHAVSLYFAYALRHSACLPDHSIDTVLVAAFIDAIKSPRTRCRVDDRTLPKPSSGAAGSLPPLSELICAVSPAVRERTLAHCLCAAAHTHCDWAMSALLAAGAPTGFFEVGGFTDSLRAPPIISCVQPWENASRKEERLPPGSLSCLKLLVEVVGLDPTVPPQYGALVHRTTAARASAAGGHVDALRYLMQCGKLVPSAAEDKKAALADLLVLSAEEWKGEAVRLLLNEAGAALSCEQRRAVTSHILLKCASMLWEAEPLEVLVSLHTHSPLPLCEPLIAAAEAAEEGGGAGGAGGTAPPLDRGALWILMRGSCPHPRILAFLLQAGCRADGALVTDGAVGAQLPSRTDTPLARAIANRNWEGVQALADAGAPLELSEPGQAEEWRRHLADSVPSD